MTERSLKELARETAVDAVDAAYGYTVEFSPAPDFHRSQYDLAESRILSALQRVKAESLKLACEAVCYAAEEHGAEYDRRVLHTAECTAICRAFAAAQDDPEVSR